MGELVEVVGDSPRVRLLSALVRLRGFEFTRGELAREADLYRMTTNRQVDRLEADGFIQRVAGGHRRKYKVNADSPTMRVIYYLDAALFLIDEDGTAPDAGEVEKAVDAYRGAIRAVVHGRPAQRVGASARRPLKRARKRAA